MNQKDVQKNMILNDDLTKVMWKLSVPAILAMVLFGLNTFMDTVYIGQLMNEKALAGVGLAYPLTMLMLGIGSWAGTGAGNLLSILLGREDPSSQKVLISNATILALLSTIVLAVPSYFFAEDIIAGLGGEGVIQAHGVSYFKIVLIGSPLWSYGLMLNFIVRAEGKMKEAAIMMVYGLGINLLLTPLFIVQFDMGVDGAAWATNVGMLIYSIVGYIYFKSDKPSFEADIHSLRYDKKVFSKILSMGFPGLIMSVMSMIQAVVTLYAITRYGTDADLAFFTTASRIMTFLMTPLFGLMRALQPMIGINYGAAQYERVKHSFMLFAKTGFFLVAPFWFFLELFPEVSLRLMLPAVSFSNTDLLNFRVYMLVLSILPIVFMALTYLPAIEKPKIASMMVMARQVIFYIPLMLLLPKWFGVSSIYYGTAAIDIVLTSLVIYYVRQSFKTFDTLPNPTKI